MSQCVLNINNPDFQPLHLTRRTSTMTTFYEELCTTAGANYINLENKKQAILRVVSRWTENSPIIEAALAGNISLQVLVGPIISPNLRISFFNREEDILGSPNFQEWSDRLFKQLGTILPLKESVNRGYPEDQISLWLPMKLSQFYGAKRHLLTCLGITAVLPLLIDKLPPPAFLYALIIGAAVGSCVELLLFCLNASRHFRRRRKMARELLRQAQNIDQIFREASLG